MLCRGHYVYAVKGEYFPLSFAMMILDISVENEKLFVSD